MLNVLGGLANSRKVDDSLAIPSTMSTINNKTLRQLKDFDTIEVVESIEKIKLENGKGVELHGILPEFVLKYAENLNGIRIVNYAYICESTNTIESYIFAPSTGLFFQAFTIHLNKHVVLQALKDREYKLTVNDDNLDTMFEYIREGMKAGETMALLLQILNVIAYIIKQMEDVDTVVKTDRKKRSGASSSGSITANTKQTRRTAKVLNKNKVVYNIKYGDDSTTKSFRKYRQHVGSYPVVGHPRRLKSDKTV